MDYQTQNGLVENYKTNRRILCQWEKELTEVKEEDQLRKKLKKIKRKKRRKLCRIMQKLTHQKISIIEERVKRLEKILLICTGSLISAMGYVIFTLLSK